MSWIEKIRQKPRAAKMRLIWIAAIAVAVLMLAVWTVSARFQKNVSIDTSLFKALSQGITNVGNNWKK
jgi:steroid 5-alpha reductase family enzyme